MALLDHTARLGGGEIALLNLARSVDPKRFSLKVILFSEGPLRVKFEQLGIDTLICPLNPDIVDARKDAMGGRTLLRLQNVFSAMKFVFQLAKLLRKSDVDLVHTNSLKADILGGAASRLAGIPVLWHVRDRISQEYLPRSVGGLFRFLARVIPHRVIANSQSTLETLRWSDRDQTPARFCVIHDGAEVGQITPQHPGDTLTVGLVGRISPWKGQHIFLKAISLVRDQIPQARFQIIGTALFNEVKYEQEMHELCRSLGVNDVVDFMGFRDDVPALMNEMQVVVHASTIGEPFGQVILEGMAAGKAVIATRGGGVPEFVDDQINGILIPMGDANAMADALALLLRDEPFRRELGRRARLHVIERFTIQHTAEKVQSVFDQALSHQSSEKLAT